MKIGESKLTKASNRNQDARYEVVEYECGEEREVEDVFRQVVQAVQG